MTAHRGVTVVGNGGIGDGHIACAILLGQGLDGAVQQAEVSALGGQEGQGVVVTHQNDLGVRVQGSQLLEDLFHIGHSLVPGLVTDFLHAGIQQLQGGLQLFRGQVQVFQALFQGLEGLRFSSRMVPVSRGISSLVALPLVALPMAPMSCSTVSLEPMSRVIRSASASSCRRVGRS